MKNDIHFNREHQQEQNANLEVLLFKCDMLFSYSIDLLLKNQSHYRLKKIDCLHELKEQVGSRMHSIVVVQHETLCEKEIEAISSEFAHVKFLFVFIESKLSINNKFLKAACFGVFFMQSTGNLFIAALQSLEKNQTFIPFSEIKGDLTTSIVKKKPANNRFGELKKLSKRQFEVTEQLCLGFKQKKIANNLGVSTHRVSALKKAVFKKLSIDSVMQLMELNRI